MNALNCLVILAGAWLLSPPAQSQGFQIEEPRHFSDPKLTAIILSSNQATKQTVQLVNQGRVKGAYFYLSDFQKKNPNAYDMTEDVGIECALMVGKVEEAYRRAKVWYSKPGHESDDARIRLVLAQALQGYSSDVELQFARSAYHQSLFPSQTKDTLVIPTRMLGTSSETAILSCLAMAFKTPGQMSNEFFEMALKIDPANYFAAREDIRNYEFRGQYSKIRRVANSTIRYMPSGQQRAEMISILERVKNLKDTPIQQVH